MLRKCGELCSYMPLQPGDMVFEQGDPADSFFIVLKGHIEAVMDKHPAVANSVDADEEVRPPPAPRPHGTEALGVERPARPPFGRAPSKP